MFKGRNTTRMLVTMALLSAIEVVLARFIVPMPNPTMRFSIEAVPIIVAGFLYGPVSGAIVGLVGDAVGCLFSGYGYNPLFAVPPMLIGLCAGLLRPLLYKKVSFLRILATFLPAVVVGSVLWQSYWLNAAVIFGLFKSRVFDVLRLWPPVSAPSTEAGADYPANSRKAIIK